jgi:hypothetical protein
MNVSKISHSDFAKFQRKLSEAGYLIEGFVSKGADWKFDFSKGREFTLLGVNHTNEKGEYSGADDAGV